VSKSIGVMGLVLMLLIAGILLVPSLWAGRMPTASCTFFSSILPPPTSPSGGTPRPPTVPPATVVFPTPPTPIPNALLIASEQAISVAMNQSPLWAQMQQRDELTVTTKLTVHGDTQAGASGVLTIHPQLPVWVVTMHMPAWKQMAGPVGKQVEVQFNAERYEIDAATGHVIGGGRAFVQGDGTPTLTPEVVR
jgi:hypothetical protein